MSGEDRYGRLVADLDAADASYRLIDHAPEGDRYFTQWQERTVIGALSLFTGEPTRAAGYAAGPTSLIAIPPEDVRRVVATAPAELGDLLLRIMVARRDWLMGRGLGQQKLIGSRWSGEAFAVRELLERNLVPFTWHDLERDEESRILIEDAGIRAILIQRQQRHTRWLTPAFWLSLAAGVASAVLSRGLAVELVLPLDRLAA